MSIKQRQRSVKQITDYGVGKEKDLNAFRTQFCGKSTKRSMKTKER